MGKPVIATNLDGLSEIVEEGITGLLIPPRDHDAIADAIIRMAGDKEKAHEMAMNGRDKIFKYFTFQRMIDLTEGVYHRVLNMK
jgi:glycosyltransferase involved in cell wall biosynthesis